MTPEEISEIEARAEAPGPFKTYAEIQLRRDISKLIAEVRRFHDVHLGFDGRWIQESVTVGDYQRAKARIKELEAALAKAEQLLSGTPLQEAPIFTPPREDG
jgi:hypothetical protein